MRATTRIFAREIRSWKAVEAVRNFLNLEGANVLASCMLIDRISSCFTPGHSLRMRRDNGIVSSEPSEKYCPRLARSLGIAAKPIGFGRRKGTDSGEVREQRFNEPAQWRGVKILGDLNLWQNRESGSIQDLANVPAVPHNQTIPQLIARPVD